MEKMLGPLFAGVDISTSITLKEFYELNGIDVYFYTTELNKFTQVKMSHKTHPDWRVIDAVYASCTLPIIFAPLIKGTECFIDGGALCSYPMKSCLDDGNDPNTILGIKKLYVTSNLINEKSSLFDYLMVVLKNTISVLNGNETALIKNEILLDGDHTTIDNLLSLASSREERDANIARGITIFNNFMKQ
jgi:predicted acylesterase/phospholipase RssA